MSDDELAVKAQAEGTKALRATGRAAELGGELAAAHRITSPPRSRAVRRAEWLGNRTTRSPNRCAR